MEDPMRNQIIVLLAVLFASAGLAPVNAGNITGGIFVATTQSVDDNTVYNTLDSFGTTSAGKFNSTGAFETAQTAWFHDHFGMFARTSMDSTGGQGGFDYAYGLWEESILIPPQQGTAQGDPGTLHLSIHLDGTVNIDVGVAIEILNGAQYASSGRVTLQWALGGNDGFNIERTWIGNQVSAVFNFDRDVTMPFQFGVPFLFVNQFKLESEAHGTPDGPSIGFAEGDFFHTGTLLGGAVFDQFGNRISNPLVISDSGFDYVNPQLAVESAVPEPSTFVVSSVLLGMFGAVWSYKRLKQTTAAA
jgi:hypothetical protein